MRNVRVNYPTLAPAVLTVGLPLEWGTRKRLDWLEVVRFATCERYRVNKWMTT